MRLSEFHYVRTRGTDGGVDACEGPAIGLDLETVLKDGLPPWNIALEVVAALCEILDIADDPSIGPNAMRHFDQSWQALATLRAGFDDKLDLITVVDEYVFGYCLHERNNLKDEVDDTEMAEYIGALLIDDEYPALTGMVSDMGLSQLWAKIDRHARDAGRGAPADRTGPREAAC